jgi:hypothetical protein
VISLPIGPLLRQFGMTLLDLPQSRRLICFCRVRVFCAERLRQKKELDLVLGERDILGTQLIRRNDELALLYEKVKIQQSTLSRGQIQYKDRWVHTRLASSDPLNMACHDCGRCIETCLEACPLPHWPTSCAVVSVTTSVHTATC